MTILDKIEKELLKETKDYVKENVKKKVIKIAEVSVIIFLAFILISIGISELIAAYFPILGNGFSYLLIGVIFILVAILIEK